MGSFAIGSRRRHPIAPTCDEKWLMIPRETLTGRQARPLLWTATMRWFVLLSALCLSGSAWSAADRVVDAREVLRRNPALAAVLAQNGRVAWKDLRAQVRLTVSRDDWDALKSGTWKLYPMGKSSKGEDELTGDERVTYLRDDSERAPYEVQIDKSGLLRGADGRPAELSSRSFLVEDPEGQLYARDHRDAKAAIEREHAEFKHSTFTAGGDLKMAIELKVERGKFHYIKAKSGHYRPGRLDFFMWLLGLERRHVDLSDTKVRFDPRSGPARSK
jgi:hypothetical protein